jgi:hypothetical protein
LRCVEIAALTMPPVLRKAYEDQIHLPKKESERLDKQFFVDHRSPIFTDMSHNFGNSASLRNVGVHHTGVHLAHGFSELKARISTADIVALESEIAPDSFEHIRGRDKFFSRLREEALNQHKILYDIDVKKPWRIDQMEKTSARAAGIAAVGLALTGLQPKFRENTVSLRRFLRTIGWIGVLTVYPPVHQVYWGNSYPATDVSFSADGRTVLMLSHLLALAKEYPGKRLLVISGNGHAIGVEFYLRHPVIFRTKRALYGLVYERFLSGPPERIREPHFGAPLPLKR